jgi:APA family basic amino acid/polyamine antiporter
VTTPPDLPARQQTSQQPLSRRLGLGGAITIGLGSMIGAGVFAVFGPAAAAAGTALLVSLLIAAVVATCNATSSAQLAAVYPQSGGTYVYGRERLGHWWGFLAGWCFIIGKTASCAAMAITFAAYAAPDAWERPLAALGVAVLAFVNYRGVTRTVRATLVIVTVVLIVLTVVVASGLVSGLPQLQWSAPTAGAAATYGILQASGLLFFAFAGYARIATMGEEVKEPARTIPRAILISLGAAVVIYAAVAIAVLGALGPAELAASEEPLIAAVQASGWEWATPVVQVGGAAASLGALLALMAGIGRTSLAMAREADLPRWLAAVHPRFGVPHRVEVTLAIIIVALVLTLDLRGAIGFSSFGVLLYYFIANLAAFTQPREARRYPRALQVLGMVGCVGLAAMLPLPSILGGLAVLGVGVLVRAGVRRSPSE